MTVQANVSSFQAKALERKVARYIELKEQQTELNKLKKELAAEFKGKSELWVGAYKVSGKEVHRSGHKVKAFSYWDWSVSAR